MRRCALNKATNLLQAPSVMPELLLFYNARLYHTHEDGHHNLEASQSEELRLSIFAALLKRGDVG